MTVITRAQKSSPKVMDFYSYRARSWEKNGGKIEKMQKMLNKDLGEIRVNKQR